jgi:hypothetical protein
MECWGLKLRGSIASDCLPRTKDDLILNESRSCSEVSGTVLLAGRAELI